MINWLRFTILALATYRLAHMVTLESGPFFIFRKLRSFVKRFAPKSTHMDEGIECPLCMSAQIGIVLAVLNYFLPNSTVFEIILLSLALSGVAVTIHQQLTKSK